MQNLDFSYSSIVDPLFSQTNSFSLENASLKENGICKHQSKSSFNSKSIQIFSQMALRDDYNEMIDRIEDLADIKDEENQE